LLNVEAFVEILTKAKIEGSGDLQIGDLAVLFSRSPL